MGVEQTVYCGHVDEVHTGNQPCWGATAQRKQRRLPTIDLQCRRSESGLAITSAGIFETGLFDLQGCKSFTKNLQICKSDRGLNDPHKMWNYLASSKKSFELLFLGGSFAA